MLQDPPLVTKLLQVWELHKMHYKRPSAQCSMKDFLFMLPACSGISSRYELGHHVSSSSCDNKIPCQCIKNKKIIMELAEHEGMLEVTFGDCSKDCHTVYKNSMQEWSWGQRGSHIKGSGRRTARLEFGLGGCYPLWIGSIVRFKENFMCGAKWNKVSGQSHALGKQCGVYLVYQL